MKGGRSGMIRGSRGRIMMLILSLVLPARAQAPQQDVVSPDMLRSITAAVENALAQEQAGAEPTAVAAATRPAQDLIEHADVPLVPEVSAADEAEDEAESFEPPDIHVSPEGRVEMHVRDLDLAVVLQMLSIQSRRNIVASNAVSGRVTANLYNVTFEEALTAILAANGAGWRERGNFIYVYTTEELKQIELASRKQISRIFRLHYIKAGDAQPLVQPLLSTEGKISVTAPAQKGVATNANEAGGDDLAGSDALLVVDYPERVDAIAKALAELDVRPRQVLIEATILRAQLNEDNALGIDFNLVGGVDFQNLSSTSEGITDLITGPLPPNRMQHTTFTTRTDFVSAVPTGGFTFGIIKDSVASFVRALEQVTDTTVLANPKILALNKQHGEVIVGRRDGYLTTTVTQTSAIQNVEFLETGTQLRFRPYIGDDGYVRMEVHPEDSTGGLTASNLPFEQTTEVTTNIIVRDGHTILIGGLFREVTSASRSQVPLVGNVPVAGALFRNSRDNTQREEVIILLTVHIVKDDEHTMADSEKLLQDAERFRVGMRQGVQWFGRERLAQAHYQWALEHLNKGRLSSALWDLDLAINNNPKFLAAIRLKEQLLDRRAWDEEGSAVRGFVLRQIMKDRGVVTPFFGRPGPPFDFLPLEGPNGFELEECAPEAQPGADVETGSSSAGSSIGQGAS